jgi:hypothetical protein
MEPTDHQTGARTARRLAANEVAMSSKAKLSPGGDVEVINISASGALVEGKNRFAVGTAVGLLTEGSNRPRVMGRITRCQVSTVHRDGTMTYQLGIAFDESAEVEAARPAEGDVSGETGDPQADAVDAAAEAITNEW